MTCKARVFSSCILVGEALPFSIDWTTEFANLWKPNSAYAALSAVRPNEATGFEYVSSGGQSGSVEPTWPTEGGETITDGSITWTSQALSNASLRERITDVDWPAVSGFTITPDSFIDEPGRQITRAKIGSEGVIRSRRNIRCEVTTTEGNDYVGILKMKVE